MNNQIINIQEIRHVEQEGLRTDDGPDLDLNLLGPIKLSALRCFANPDDTSNKTSPDCHIPHIFTPYSINPGSVPSLNVPLFWEQDRLTMSTKCKGEIVMGYTAGIQIM